MLLLSILLAFGLIATSQGAPVAAPTAAESPAPDSEGSITLRADSCPGLIIAKWDSLSGPSGPLGSPVGGLVSTTATHQNYAKGAIYCKGTTGPAYAIYGSVYTKFLQYSSTSVGYPTSDQTFVYDNTGVQVSCNTLSIGGAICSTSAHGAHLIYGHIYQEWVSRGGVKSALGYPTTDESPTGTHGGRYNDFSNGMIYWHLPSNVWVKVGPLPTSLTFPLNPIKFDGAPLLSASASVVISSNGNCRWNSVVHAADIMIYKYTLAFELVSADQQPYVFSRVGQAGPNYQFLGGQKDDIADRTVFSEEILYNWRALVANNAWEWNAKPAYDPRGAITELTDGFKSHYPLFQPAIAIMS